MKRYQEIDNIMTRCQNEEEIFLLNELTIRRNIEEDKNVVKNHKLAFGNVKENGQIKKFVAIYDPKEIEEDAAEDICIDSNIKSLKVVVLPKSNDIIEKFR